MALATRWLWLLGGFGCSVVLAARWQRHAKIKQRDGLLGVPADLALHSALLLATLGVPIPKPFSNLLIRGIDSATAIAIGSYWYSFCDKTIFSTHMIPFTRLRRQARCIVIAACTTGSIS